MRRKGHKSIRESGNAANAAESETKGGTAPSLKDSGTRGDGQPYQGENQGV